MDNNIIISSYSLLLLVAHSDGKFDLSEAKIIDDIIIDFYSIDKEEIKKIQSQSLSFIENNKTIVKYSNILNEKLSYNEKIDFIKCIYEVAFIDKTLHYFENHMIKNIANALSVEHSDLIKAKIEIKNYLD